MNIDKRIEEVTNPRVLARYSIITETHPKTLNDYRFVILDKKWGTRVFESTYYTDNDFAEEGRLEELIRIITEGLDGSKGKNENKDSEIRIIKKRTIQTEQRENKNDIPAEIVIPADGINETSENVSDRKKRKRKNKKRPRN